MFKNWERRMDRRLVAILAADVVGYSRLMGEDGIRTIEALTDLRKNVFEPIVSARGGRIVKRMGDGWLVEFPNASDAVAAAMDIQKDVAENEHLKLRIGVHVGDVTFQEEDIFGDGVNIAARLEAIAESGMVVISDTVYNDLDGVSSQNFGGGETQQLKNISRPVTVWRWPNQNQPNANNSTEAVSESAYPDKPSIVVLPFMNMSSEPEQAFFSDGIVEDLITALSRFPWLFVISRNTSFSYKGESIQIRRVAEELGVRYVVEGSVRMSSTRLRVTVQLIDATSDRHVWAENYDRPTGDLFDLQDEISQAITGVLVPALGSAERERYRRDNRPSLDAWAAYQKALLYYYRPYDEADHAACRRLLDQSIDIDPNFSDAHAMIAMMGIYSINSGQTSHTGSREEILAEAKQAAQHAVQMDDSNALAHVALGRVYQLGGEYTVAVAEGETATKLNPNLAIAHHELGFILSEIGRLEQSIPCFDKAIRLSPNDPSRWNFFLIKGISLFGLGEFEQAIANLEEASRLRPSAFWPYLGLAAVYVGQGRMEEARTAVNETLKRNPNWTAAQMLNIFGVAPSDHLVRYVDNLRQAGLP
jgi:adenylate cyclase